jgi:hypothetical protein
MRGTEEPARQDVKCSRESGDSHDADIYTATLGALNLAQVETGLLSKRSLRKPPASPKRAEVRRDAAEDVARHFRPGVSVRRAS